MSEEGALVEEYVELSKKQDAEIKLLSERAKSIIRRDKEEDKSKCEIFGLSATNCYNSSDDVSVMNDKLKLRSYTQQMKPVKIIE